MTEQEAKLFFDDLQAFKKKWNCEFIIDCDYRAQPTWAVAEFPDSTRINIEIDYLTQWKPH